FRYGYISSSNDFNSLGYIPTNAAPTSIGNNMTIAGMAYVSNGIVHITDLINAQIGSLVVTNVGGGGPVDRFVIRYKASLFSGGTPADGYSLNIAPNLPLTAGTGEDGTGSGLTVAFDNFDNGGGEAPSVDLRYNGVKLIDTTNATSASTFKSPATIASIIRTANGAFKDV